MTSRGPFGDEVFNPQSTLNLKGELSSKALERKEKQKRQLYLKTTKFYKAPTKISKLPEDLTKGHLDALHAKRIGNTMWFSGYCLWWWRSWVGRTANWSSSVDCENRAVLGTQPYRPCSLLYVPRLSLGLLLCQLKS
jgi:hypothetical protein